MGIMFPIILFGLSIYLFGFFQTLKWFLIISVTAVLLLGIFSITITGLLYVFVYALNALGI